MKPRRGAGIATTSPLPLAHGLLAKISAMALDLLPDNHPGVDPESLVLQITVLREGKPVVGSYGAVARQVSAGFAVRSRSVFCVSRRQIELQDVGDVLGYLVASAFAAARDSPRR